MSLPSSSPYKHLYATLPANLKESIIIVKRTKSGETDYKRPEWTETQRTVEGIFQLLDITDMIVEEGGLRQTTQGKLFLPIDLVTWEDPFSNEGTPLLLYWQDPGASDFTVTGGRLVVTPGKTLEANYGQLGTIDRRILYGAFEWKWDLNWIQVQGGQRVKFLSPTDPDDYIDFYNDGGYMEINVSHNGIKEEDRQIMPGGGLGELQTWRVEWVEEEVLVYADGKLWAHFENPDTIPNVSLMPTISHALVILPAYYVYYMKVLGRDDDIGDGDQFIIRDRRWSQMKKVYKTMLQREYLLQEVIP